MKISAPKIKLPKIKIPKITIGKDLGVGAIKDAIGNATDGYVDVLTLGQKDLVDSYTSGAASSLQGTYRGNSKDAVRTAATVGTAYFGGPAAAVAVNQVLGQGGTIGQAAQIGFGASGAPGLGSIIGKLFGGGAPEAPAGFAPDTGYWETPDYIGGREIDVPWPVMALIGVLVIGLIIFLKKRKK